MAGDNKFTAVVFFHGVGQQSRYEELSRVLESFDDYAVVQDDKRLESFTVGVEPSQATNSTKDIGYVTFKRDGREFRFYEVYWAPLTNVGTTGWQVFEWFMGHITTPLKISTSDWYSRRRLRASYLYQYWDDKHRDSTAFIPLMTLVNLYDDFCDKAMRGGKIKGKFDDFVAYIQQESKPEDAEGLVTLANTWRDYMHRTERWNFMIFLTIGYILAILPVATIARIGYLTNVQNHLQNPLVWLIILAFVPLLGLISRVFKDYGGDVQLWATYQETNEKYQIRQEILRLGITSMTHVLNHENCDRVVMLAHSLGTTIAFDTLLAIGRHNRAIESERADAPMPDNLQAFGAGGGVNPPVKVAPTGTYIDPDKIEYFVTMGSPIDKIYYFFESRQGLFRPYELIVDDVRGDIGLSPFVLDRGIPNFRWINFWAQEDYISGSLTTPNPRRFTHNEQKINNVLVKNFEFPSPGRSHIGYFRNNTVIGTLYRLIFLRDEAESSRQLADLLKTRPKLQTQRLRNGLLLASWSMLLGIIFDILRERTTTDLPIWQVWNGLFWGMNVIVAGLFMILTIAIIISFSRGGLTPFKRWDKRSQ